MKFLSVIQLKDRAEMYGAELIGELTHQSLPIPIMRDNALKIAYFYSHAEIVEPREGLKIWPPAYVGIVDAMSGMLEQIKTVSPENFSRNDDVTKPLGSYLTHPQRLEGGFLSSATRLYQSLDQLLPEFVNNHLELTEQAMEAVKMFKKEFDAISEKSLLPYYRHFGEDFFRWVDNLLTKIEQPK
ncbi:MAG: hypothetical protein OEX00_08330 [Gammaproteobacteria bacterium]|nr:hypothetical protein [Gammaproteobacteria bacterium]MDH5693932.1 hypothetical protein [Gammaproteobacteria bacterium]